MQTENDRRSDFDFLVGNFIMRHRRLKERLKVCTEWEEFDGTAVGKKILNGLGHCDEVIIHREMGYNYGYTLLCAAVWKILIGWRVNWLSFHSNSLCGNLSS